MDIENPNEGQPADVSNEASTAPASTPSTEGDSSSTQTLLAGKYKSVEELEKGYRESTKYGRDLNAKVKELQNSIPKAPEDYSFDLSNIEGMEGYEISADDPDMKSMIPVFKELNLTQDQVTRLVSAHLKNMDALAESPDQIKEKLGSNADIMIGKLQEYTNKLPAKDQQIMQALADTSDGIDFLYRHLIGAELATPGVSGTGSSGGAKSAAELKSEAFKYKSDNIKSIGFNRGQQEQYKKMLHAALVAEENEAKAKK